jgi:hypothetical protein
MYKVIMKDTLNWMNDIKLVTHHGGEVLDFVHKYGANVTEEDLINSDMVEVITADGLKLTIMID